MGYNLTIDQGNSAAKVVVWCDNNLVAVSHYSTFSDSEIRELANQFPIENAIYCSVGNAETQVVESLRNFAKGIVLELSHTTPMPLLLDYATPQTLGRDRIAAAMGAYDKFRGNTILVVDIGTAVTYDVVTADGHFAGLGEDFALYLAVNVHIILEGDGADNLNTLCQYVGCVAHNV